MHTASGPIRNLRTRTGCLTCRQRKVKCGEEKPLCFNCQRLHKVCNYEVSPYHRSSDARPQVHNSENGRHFASDTASDIMPADLDSSGHSLLTSPPQSFVEMNWLTGEWGDLLEGVNNEIFSPDSVRFSLEMQGEQLLDIDNNSRLNLNAIEIPFITPFDIVNWRSFTKFALRLALSQPTIALCISAVEHMSFALLQGVDTADALPHYFTARSAYVRLLKDVTVDLEVILIATFLLCCTEVLAQQETVPVTLKQKDNLITRVEQDIGRPKSPIVRRIIAWLHLFHAKAAHFGGRGLLSPRLLELLGDEDQYIPSITYLSAEQTNIDCNTASILHDLFQFYHALQHVSIRASRLNRHHRSRGTIDDEIDVASISFDIEQRLGYLWKSRPTILRAHLHQLNTQAAAFDPQVTLTVNLCILAYNAEIIYHARANGRQLEISPDVVAAKETIRSTVTVLKQYNSDWLLEPALMWPLFQYSIESKTQMEVEWALKSMHLISGPLWHADFFKDFAQALTTEQLARQERVDSRYFCIKHSGISPPFM